MKKQWTSTFFVLLLVKKKKRWIWIGRVESKRYQKGFIIQTCFNEIPTHNSTTVVLNVFKCFFLSLNSIRDIVRVEAAGVDTSAIDFASLCRGLRCVFVCFKYKQHASNIVIVSIGWEREREIELRKHMFVVFSFVFIYDFQHLVIAIAIHSHSHSHSNSLYAHSQSLHAHSQSIYAQIRVYFAWQDDSAKMRIFSNFFFRRFYWNHKKRTTFSIKEFQILKFSIEKWSFI